MMVGPLRETSEATRGKEWLSSERAKDLSKDRE